MITAAILALTMGGPFSHLRCRLIAPDQPRRGRNRAIQLKEWVTESLSVKRPRNLRKNRRGRIERTAVVRFQNHGTKGKRNASAPRYQVSVGSRT
jgi:hypothetical protein